MKDYANFDFILKALSGSESGIRSFVQGHLLYYEDDTVSINFIFSPATHYLLEAKCIWYSNNYQCLKFVDKTKEGCLNYFRMFGLKVKEEN